MKVKQYSLDSNIYYIAISDGIDFEFCINGDIKVFVFSSDYKYFSNSVLLPGLEELELFYNAEVTSMQGNTVSIKYSPLFNNARLL